MKRIAILALSVVTLSTYTSSAAEAANPYRESLSRVSPAELPPKSADLIKHSKGSEQAKTTINVVKAAVEINPAAAPAIVGGIAREVPDVAAVAAGTAAAEQPRQAGTIAKAAAAAAPKKAGKIVTMVCRAVPNEYMSIATAVAQVAPDATREILEGVAAALPQLKFSIDRVLVGYRGQPSVPTVLNEASKTAAAQPTTLAAAPGTTLPVSGAPGAGAVAGSSSASGSAARGPAVGPPYIPLVGTPGNVTPGTSGDVPTGGRNYAAP